MTQNEIQKLHDLSQGSTERDILTRKAVKLLIHQSQRIKQLKESNHPVEPDRSKKFSDSSSLNMLYKMFGMKP